MNENMNSVIEATTAAAENLPVVASKTGDLLRQAAGFADKNQAAAIGIAAVAVVAVGYVSYRAFTNREGK